MPGMSVTGRRRRLKLPQGNGLVLAVLRSRAHRLASGMVCRRSLKTDPLWVSEY
jgi:hypothetical protein